MFVGSTRGRKFALPMDYELEKQQLDALLKRLDPDSIDKYPSEPSVLEAQVFAISTVLSEASASPVSGPEFLVWLNTTGAKARHDVGLARQVTSGVRVLEAERVCHLLVVYSSVLRVLSAMPAESVNGATAKHDCRNSTAALFADAREIVTTCGKLIAGTALMEFLIKQHERESPKDSPDIVWGLMSMLGVKFAPRLCRIVSG